MSPSRTFAAVDRIGTQLGGGALRALAEGVEVAGYEAHATAVTTPVTLDLEALDPADVAAGSVAWREKAAAVPPAERAVYDIWADWADAWLATSDREGSWSSRVGLVRIGDVALVTLPNEPFLGIADAIRARLGRVLVLGYTDGVAGYVPTADEYQHGGYEVLDAHRYYGMPAPFAPDSADRLVAAAVGLGGPGFASGSTDQ